ncbi:hypothetical protein KGQ20_02630 [Catenulispora sp. NF23]|nr:hypothetical protein [Catenulispora pinistramenti]
MGILLAASAKARWRVEGVQFGATVTFGVFAYAVGAVAAATVTLPHAGAGFLWPGYLLLGLALLVGAAGIGHLAGRWARNHYTAPLICGLAVFLAIAWLGSPTSVFGFFVLNGSPYMAPGGEQVVLRCLAAALLVVAALTFGRLRANRAHASWRAGWWWAIRATAMVLALVGTLTAMSSAGAVQVARSAPSAPVCTHTVPRVCLWPDDRKYLSQADAMARHLAALPQATFTAPAVIYERGLRSREFTYKDFYILEGSMWDPSETIAGEVMQYGSLACPADESYTTRQIDDSITLMMWLSMRIYGGPQPSRMHSSAPAADIAIAAQMLTKSEGEQFAWAVRLHDSLVRDGVVCSG